MSMRFVFLITMAIMLAFPAKGQTCDCESNFEWIKKTFEENDAGFQYILEKKGQTAYNIHNQLMLEKVKSAKTLTDCTKLLYEWLTFFRLGHIGIELIQTEQNFSQTANKSNVSEKREINIPQFEKYISTKQETDFEGIWETGAYKIGIQKEGNNYTGFIIEADVDGWREQGQVKLKIKHEGDKLKSTFYMRDHSPVESEKIELIGNNYLQIGQQTLKRLNPIFHDEKYVENYIKLISSQNPYLEELNSNTLYFRIPSFDLSYKPAIDKLIADNREKILKTKNLIIDVRNNGGGGDGSFAELTPFLYTNPIRVVAIEFLSTVLNNKAILELSMNADFSENERKGFKDIYDKFQAKMGEYVNPFDDAIYVRNQDIVYEYPNNVGIIINERNGSTTEQFLYEAKQSKKVKLFGVTTSGALDMSNMNSVESPCKEFELWYCMSKSIRVPDMTIDDIGLQPDYYLDKTIPQYKWVEFVSDILNQ